MLFNVFNMKPTERSSCSSLESLGSLSEESETHDAQFSRELPYACLIGVVRTDWSGFLKPTEPALHCSPVAWLTEVLCKELCCIWAHYSVFFLFFTVMYWLSAICVCVSCSSLSAYLVSGELSPRLWAFHLATELITFYLFISVPLFLLFLFPLIGGWNGDRDVV